MESSLFDILGVSLGASVIRALLALVTAYIVLVLLDIINNQRFGVAQEIINEDPRATAHYRGMRFLAVCIVVGLLFS